MAEDQGVNGDRWTTQATILFAALLALIAKRLNDELISITRRMPPHMLAKTDKGTYCPALDGLEELRDGILTMLTELKEPQP